MLDDKKNEMALYLQIWRCLLNTYYKKLSFITVGSKIVKGLRDIYLLYWFMKFFFLLECKKIRSCF